MSEGLETESEPQAPPTAETASRPATEPAPSRIAWLALLIGALLAAGFLVSWWLVVVILGLMVMITIHELGHFLTAKWSGMKVTEFFFGFGPRLWSFRRGETEYGFKPIPAGAYVRIVGMNNLDEVDPEDEPRSYRQQSFPKRLLTVLAGPATHFVQAAILVFLLLAVTGVPGGSIVQPDTAESKDWVVTGVTPDSAADDAGLEDGDRIVAFNGESVANFEELTGHIRASEVGEEVTLSVERDGERFDTTTTIKGRPEEFSAPGAQAGGPFLGVGPTIPDVELGVGEALRETPKQTLDVIGASLSAMGGLFSPSGIGNFADQVSEGGGDKVSSDEPASSGSRASSDEGESNEGRPLSIIGVAHIGATLAEESTAGLLGVFLSINIFVGLLNLIPLLPFDGGHASVAIYERIRSRRGRPYRADVTKLLPFAYAVVMVLVVLGVTTIYLDIVDPVEL